MISCPGQVNVIPGIPANNYSKGIGKSILIIMSFVEAHQLHQQ